MLIGLDLDNTIVCYDRVFATLAKEAGLPAPVCEGGKPAIRSFLRKEGREPEWTMMQGHAYGKRMGMAEPYAGVIDFIGVARSGQHALAIVSHRTLRPFLGEPFDLHAAAEHWLEALGLLDRLDLFLETSMESKAARITELGCDVFVDDLPEFLSRQDFPAATRRVLFDPSNILVREPIERAVSWLEVSGIVFGE
jgi:hypothetical protein